MKRYPYIVSSGEKPLAVAFFVTAYTLIYTGGAGQRPPNAEVSDTLPASTDAVIPASSCPQYFVDEKIKNWIKFQGLVDLWRRERGAMSSITEMSILPAYQKIIGMGEDAVPLILAELKSEGDDPDQWFWALIAITEENPVKPEDQGNFRKMAQAWFQWAEAEGYAW
ncbi:MAG TPA: hypothetical protein VJX30_10860 [Terriglobales bacterium]|jgi:hypothetical protein|nr:hypothetical protein [Terriglobales bacterium]